jgi:hypothetical protein
VIRKEEFRKENEVFEEKEWIQDRDGRFSVHVVRVPRHSHDRC